MGVKITLRNRLLQASVLALVLILQAGCGGRQSTIWILDDTDEDYKAPGDEITIMDFSGNVLKVLDGFNTTQSVGNSRVIAVSPDGKYILVSELVSGELSRYDPAGELVWSVNHPIDGIDIKAVDISENGYAYALTSKGSIHGNTILEINPKNGEIFREVAIGGFNIVVDDLHNTIWIVGTDIKNLNLDLNLRYSIDPIGWVASSVDFGSDGSAWVVEREYMQGDGSNNRLLKISLDGSISLSVRLDSSPMSVRVDRNGDDVWVAALGALYKFDKDGNLVLRINQPTISVAIDQGNSTIWAAAFRSGDIYHYSKEGDELLNMAGFSSSDKYIAVHSIPK